MQNLRPREGVASGETVLTSKLLLKTTPPKVLVYTIGPTGSNRTVVVIELFMYVVLVILLLFIFPLATAIIEAALSAHAVSIVFLA
jgi:hypothetical protein